MTLSNSKAIASLSEIHHIMRADDHNAVFARRAHTRRIPCFSVWFKQQFSFETIDQSCLSLGLGCLSSVACRLDSVSFETHERLDSVACRLSSVACRLDSVAFETHERLGSVACRWGSVACSK